MMAIRPINVFVLTIWSFLSFLNCLGQSLPENIADTLNQRSKNGKRTGYWIEYVDGTLVKTKKKKAVFYRYVLYDNGVSLNSQISHFRKVYLVATGNQLRSRKIVLLDGIYCLYNYKGGLSAEEHYKNGKLLSSKSFYTNGQVYEHIDYTDQYNEQQGSYKITIYKDTDELKIHEQYYFAKKENGRWGLIKVIVDK